MFSASFVYLIRDSFAYAITICYHSDMKAAHHRTLTAIFTTPTPKNLA